MQRSREDYLMTIYLIYEKLEDKSLGIRSVEIAKELNISKPSVSEMIRNLSKSGLIRAKLYSNIHFTKKGLAEATRIIHNHRIIEVFLKKMLGYKSISKMHNEAHKLEHAFSDESIKRLEKFLKKPKRTPSGSIIPRSI